MSRLAALRGAVLAAGRRQPVLLMALLAGVAMTAVLATPWFGGGGERPQEPSAGEAEAPLPEPMQAPSPVTEAPQAAPAEPSTSLEALVPVEPPAYQANAALTGGSLASVRSEPVIRAGVANGLPELRVLGPEHVGATLDASPTLYWFLSGASPRLVEITLTSERAAEPLLALRLDPPVRPGLHALRLGPRGVALEPGVIHRWSVALVADPADRDADLVAGAAVRRTAADAALAEQIDSAPPAMRANVLAAAGYWYDAFDTLTRRIQTEPADERLREQRAALLDQVGLSGVAALLPAPEPR
jgi:hypothetical protein